MLRLRTWLSLAVVAACVRSAAGAADDKKSADIQVWAIRATTKNKEISPELKDIADTLKKQFKYTGFKLEKRATGKADIDKPFSTSLVGSYQARITPRKNDGRKIQMHVEVLKGKESKYNATVTLDAGKFQLQGGWELEGGDVLIVAVSGR